MGFRYLNFAFCKNVLCVCQKFFVWWNKIILCAFVNFYLTKLTVYKTWNVFEKRLRAMPKRQQDIEVDMIDVHFTW
jgi:hypothetical protein